MIVCFAFLFFGCMGSSPDDYDGDDDTFETVVDMYGTKVLYRPNSYDYDVGSGATNGQSNDYYGKYAWNILNNLLRTYGYANNNALQEYLPEFSSTGNRTADLPYIFDSVRYKVDTVGTVNKLKTIDAEGNETITDIESQNQYLIIGANFAQNWTWSFDYDLSSYNSIYNALLVKPNFSYTSGNRVYSTAYSNLASLGTDVNYIYNSTSYQNAYSTIFLGTLSAEDTANYSDYVKALEYVIYCYALDLEPAEISVTINDNVSSSNPHFYTVQVGTYTANDDKSSAEVALDDIKSLFKKIGSYVGLVSRQINKIGAWVKTNVVGYQSKILNDNFFRYSSVTEVVTTDAGGNTTTTYEFDISNMSASPLGRNYFSAVDKIMDNVCDLVSIGKDGEENLTIDNRFLASEVKEYAGNTFLIAGDENFPKYEESQSPVAIQPLEYQSATIMLKDNMQIDEIWIALKYDADLDGTIDGVWDENRYIDIIVELNYFSHAKQKLYTIGSQQTRVHDGPYELSGSFPTLLPEDHGTLFFSDFAQTCKDEELKSMLVNDAVNVGAFNPNIGDGILKTDVGLSGYNGIPLVSQNPLVLVGTTNVRKYYKVIEPSEGELSGNSTYITGRLNENMFKGSDGCDYIEITYKVLKQKGDSTTNYKFYTGIAAIFDSGAL